MLWLLLLSLLQGLTASNVWTGYIIIITKQKEDLLNFNYKLDEQRTSSKPIGNPSDLVRIFYFIFVFNIHTVTHHTL